MNGNEAKGSAKIEQELDGLHLSPFLLLKGVADDEDDDDDDDGVF